MRITTEDMESETPKVGCWTLKFLAGLPLLLTCCQFQAFQPQLAVTAIAELLSVVQIGTGWSNKNRTVLKTC